MTTNDGATPSGTGIAGVDPHTLQLLSKLPTATLAAQLRRVGVDGTVIGGLDVLRPDLRLLGVARTLRYLSVREDLASSLGTSVQRSMLETMRAGDVLVIDARGDLGAGVIGDISAQRVAVLGAVGIVTDSPLRDSEILASFGLAVYHRGAHPAQPSHRHVPYDSDVAVSIAGVTIEPGDLLVGDRDGIVVIPPARATEVALAAATQEDEERFVARNVAAGESLTGLYPLGAQWRHAYEAQRESAG